MTRIVLAVLDEPPFCWLAADGTGAGCDVEVLSTVLARAGIGPLAVREVTFAELIPGVVAGRWHVNTPMFVTEARRRLVRFTRPVWAVPDGLIVRGGDEARFRSYQNIGADPRARLGVVTGQVQAESARAGGVPEERMVLFATQDDAVLAVRRGEVDAAASTAIGNRALLARAGDTELVAVDVPGPEVVPLGAYSLSHGQSALAELLDAELARFLGTAEHREIMLRHGFTDGDVDAGLKMCY